METKKLIQVAVAGAHGRMGQEIVRLLNNESNMRLIATLTRDNASDPAFSATSSGKLLDVLIDFSVREALHTHIKLCQRNKAAMVVGITGLSNDEKAYLQDASQHIPIVYGANMSIGANLSFKLLETAAHLLKQESSADIAIHEIHHKLKKDAPSGTAARMREILLTALDQKTNQDKIPITSQRLGEVFGEHTVVFSLPGEQLEITHKASSRAIFARGAILAARWVINKPPQLYSMQDVLGLKEI